MYRINIIDILIFPICLIGMASGCKNTSDNTGSARNKGPVFIRMEASQTGITFNNELLETEEENALIFDGFYTGAGSAVLDVNNDGLQDIMFVSNQGPDKLYLNLGDFKFKDISRAAGVEGGNEWGGGVTAVDINADGWDDIYVCNGQFLDANRRRNKLYINNKNNTFTERAREYGLDDPGFSIQSAFFDYDLDGDLDVYVVNQPPNHNVTRDVLMATNKPDFQYTSRLYRNNGNETFTDVTEEAGLKTFAFGLSATVGDFFNDGYPDIYIANDYDYGDYLFVNLGNGKFMNVANLALRHISNFSMGADAADINNDGWLDIFVADMTPEDHYRNKTNMAAMDPGKFWRISKAGNHYQYMVNTLQLNQGNGLFSEIGQMAGVAKTDWSWSAIFCDFDNDMQKDLFVTNGILRDIRNRDFISYAFEAFKDKSISRLKIMEHSPSVPIQNYMYQNEGNLHFKSVAGTWGVGEKSFSQGASYADLDNDGDVDLIVNNMNQEAFIYKNQTVENEAGNFVRIKLEGASKNRKSFGARILIAYDTTTVQMAELINARGYMSCSEPIVHFGLGNNVKVDSIFVRWPGGKYIRVDNVNSNTEITIREKDATTVMNEQIFQVVPFILADEVTEEYLENIKHTENEYDDYKREVLIPYKQSTLGPSLESGDVNGDGLEDIFLGGSVGSSGQLLLQNENAGYIQQGKYRFTESASRPWEKYRNSEITDVHFFDADGDGDLDIYTASGSNEYPEGSKWYADHLYLNNGKAVFTDATTKIPAMHFSKSVVRSSDIDGDGDLDLFLGGRLVPGKYAKSTRSAILINKNGRFEDQTNQYMPLMAGEFDCVTDACWVDLDNDKDEDLVIVGEWAPVRIFRNERTKLQESTSEYKTDSLLGWWSSVNKADVNSDGKMDLVLGNLGLNTKFKASKEKPLSVYVNDFDGNGSWDTYLATKNNEGKMFPVRGRQCSSEQMPFISDKFKTYDEFAKASVEEILEGKLEGSIHKIATEFHSMVLVNNGDNSFRQVNLPPEAQISQVNSIAFYDFNKDGLQDLLLAGNYYNREIETARSDASVGEILLNLGDGSFGAISNAVSGLKLFHDLREIRLVRSKDSMLIIAANNNEKMQVFRIKV